MAAAINWNCPWRSIHPESVFFELRPEIGKETSVIPVPQAQNSYPCIGWIRYLTAAMIEDRAHPAIYRPMMGCPLGR